VADHITIQCEDQQTAQVAADLYGGLALHAAHEEPAGTYTISHVTTGLCVVTRPMVLEVARAMLVKIATAWDGWATIGTVEGIQASMPDSVVALVAFARKTGEN
jgi:hypothetical protein